MSGDFEKYLNEPAYTDDRVYPVKAKPGERAVCANCGLSFVQQGDGVTAGNICEVCWELRNRKIAEGIQRMNRFEKRRPFYVALFFLAFVFVLYVLPYMIDVR